MSGNKGDDKKRHKRKYRASAAGLKRPKNNSVDPTKNIRGVLISTNRGKENDCAAEMLSWLEEVADKHFPAKSEAAQDPSDQSTSSSAPVSVADALEAELAALRNEAKASGQRPARTNDSIDGEQKVAEGQGSAGIDVLGRVRNINRIKECARQNMVFIQVTDESIDPAQLTLALLKDAQSSGIVSSRFAQRLIPVQGTCYSSMDELERLAGPLLQKFFADKPLGKTFCARWKKYCGDNKQMQRMDCIKAVVRLMPPGFVVAMDKPDYWIDIVLVTKLTGLCVMENHPLLEKANVNQLAPQAADAKDADPPELESAKRIKTLSGQPASTAPAPSDALENGTQAAASSAPVTSDSDSEMKATAESGGNSVDPPDTPAE